VKRLECKYFVCTVNIREIQPTVPKTQTHIFDLSAQCWSEKLPYGFTQYNLSFGFWKWWLIFAVVFIPRKISI
jgi:hypothetical protein